MMGEGGGALGFIFAGYVPLASEPLPIIVYFVANYRLHLSHLWANMQCSRSQPNSQFLFNRYLKYVILNEEHFTFHLQCKHSGTFANRKYEEPSYPKNQKMCDPSLVDLLKIPPYYSQCSRENARDPIQWHIPIILL